MNIYIASKLWYYPRWQALRTEWGLDEINIISRWIDHAPLETKAEPSSSIFKTVWICDVEDISSSDFLLLYAEPQDILRGALVEAGIAIANGIEVLLVGDNLGFGTWQYHPLVTKIGSLEGAKQLLLMRKTPQ